MFLATSLSPPSRHLAHIGGLCESDDIMYLEAKHLVSVNEKLCTLGRNALFEYRKMSKLQWSNEDFEYLTIRSD